MAIMGLPGLAMYQLKAVVAILWAIIGLALNQLKIAIVTRRGGDWGLL